MTDFKETCINATNVNELAEFCSSERKWINKILKLREKYPDEVTIRCDPENNHGVIVAHIPKSWMKVAPPRQVNYTDEQKVAMAERLLAARNKIND